MGELEREEREIFYFFSLLLSKIYENRIEVFVGKKGKLIYASQATRGYQNLSVSSNSKRVKAEAKKL